MIVDNSAASQKQKVLEFLKRKGKQGATTFEIRHMLDIPCVAPRVYALRHEEGYVIQTLWTTAHNPGGGQHRIALYVLSSNEPMGGHHAKLSA